jgi:outer membrane lipoprotein-sorting protein
MRHIVTSALLSVAVVWAGVAPARAQTADEIIEKHLAALGGRAALAKITSRRATGTVTVTTPGGDITGPYEASYKAPNKTRVMLKLDTVPLGGPGDIVIDQRFDGVSGITMNSMQGDTVIAGNQLDNMKNGGFPSGLLSYKERGLKAEVLSREQVGGRDLIVVRMTPKAGSVAKIYLDPATHLIVRTVATVNSPDQGDFEQVIEFSDYRTVDGVKVAFQTVNSTPTQKFSVTIAKVEHNVALEDALFSRK